MPGKKKFKADPVTMMKSLSSNLRGLKFMQRAIEQIETKAEKEESFEEPTLANVGIGKQKFVVNPSYQFCERLRFGRRSFQGMNLEVENLMKVHDAMLDSSTAGKRSRTPSEDGWSDNDEIDRRDDDTDDDLLDSIECP